MRPPAVHLCWSLCWGHGSGSHAPAQSVASWHDVRCSSRGIIANQLASLSWKCPFARDYDRPVSPVLQGTRDGRRPLAGVTHPPTTKYCYQVLLPSTATNYCYQLLLPTTATNYCYQLLLPSTATNYCYQLLLPATATGSRPGSRPGCRLDPACLQAWMC